MKTLNQDKIKSYLEQKWTRYLKYLQEILWVQQAEWLIRVNKQVTLGSFLLCFIKICHGTSSNVLHSKDVMASYVIIKIHNVTSSYNVVTSLVTSLTMHVRQVIGPIGIKGGCMQYGLVLSPKTFEQLDCSKHMQVATCLVHPHGWSLLPSTVFHMLLVFLPHTCSLSHVLKYSRETWECRSLLN